MLVVSHYLIGNYIYKSLFHDSNNKSFISQILFAYGNVLPDLHPRLSQIDHYVTCTSAYLEEFTKKSQNSNISVNQRIVSLGVICHFLSDYFCTYHAFPSYRKKSIFRHLFYELRLHLHLTFLLLFYKKTLTALFTDNIQTYSDINTMITMLQQDYFKEEVCMMSDIVFAFRATYMAASWLLDFPVHHMGENAHSLWWPVQESERSFQ